MDPTATKARQTAPRSPDADLPGAVENSGASATKQSYTIPCASAFRDAVEVLAASRGVNVGDIARSVLLVFPDAVIAAHPDPGEPPPQDREVVILKSGPAEGRPWRRKPRLQVRMAPGYAVQNIRRALGLALAMERGDIAVRLDGAANCNEPAQPIVAPAAVTPAFVEDPAAHAALKVAREEIDRMRAVISVLGFEPLSAGVNSRAEALYVLGFPPGSWPDGRAIRGRFRMLATIHHPDSHFGDHARMSQLNQAMEFLRDGI